MAATAEQTIARLEAEILALKAELNQEKANGASWERAYNDLSSRMPKELGRKTDEQRAAEAAMGGRSRG